MEQLRRIAPLAELTILTEAAKITHEEAPRAHSPDASRPDAHDPDTLAVSLPFRAGRPGAGAILRSLTCWSVN